MADEKPKIRVYRGRSRSNDIDEKPKKSKREERDRDRERDDKDREREDKENERDRERERARERERRREREDREKAREREDREKTREREEREKTREREEREKTREREEREKTREREEREKTREREDREKTREREDREKTRERIREREKRRDSERDEREKRRESEKDEREKRRELEREREEREKRRELEREREEREKRRELERERERERERDSRELERERDEREKRRELEREREEREKRRESKRDEREKHREFDVERDADDRDRERKRRRRDEDYDREQGRDRERDRDRERSRRKEDDGGDGSRRRRSEEEALESSEKKKTREEDLEEEQRKLEEEMDKRRRRVQEWQELKRKKEENEREKTGDENTEEQPKSGKNWTLEGESDDEESVPASKSTLDLNDGDAKFIDRVRDGDPMLVDSSENDKSGGNIEQVVESVNGGSMNDAEEIDPLDAFMSSMVLPEVEKLNETDVSMTDKIKSEPEKKGPMKENGGGFLLKKSARQSTGRIIPGEDSDSDYGDLENDEAPLEDEDDDEFMKRVKKTKVEKLSIVDHTKIQYPPFRKNFYIEVREIARMTPEEVAAYRKQLELKIHGKDVPKPVKSWNQTGLTSKILDTIKKLNYEKPMPIQAQALPIIMNGRDCIGIGKTGSGKTLAFVLPMLRHIKDQPEVVAGDGPIGLIMAPTRELVQQIHSDIKKFAKAMGVRCVPVYGGSGVAQQISDLKRGTEIVVCTPGRMIDILCTSSGKITNLRRVTYLVMDEADRMFDMGFEPQITRIVQNTRPDRQTVLFSATFPRQVEILARKVLTKPVEIQVGGRSVVNKDITQMVEVRHESERFLRLLELLGEWYEKGKMLIFVHSQEKCDSLFKELIKHGYPCLSLHGAKDQTDRESTISDFKSNVCNLLIATSIAARGLDVKELELVVNYDVPNHYEDYVHRVGRTGRAGRKGCAITFISEEDARYAPDLVKALDLSEQVVPDDLKALADGFMAKVNQGTEQAHGTGYGGSGFKFNEEEDEARKAAKKAQAREYGFEEDKSDSDSEDDGVRKAGGDISHVAALAQAAALAAVSKVAITTMPTPVSASQLLPNGGLLPAVALPGVMAGLPNASALPMGSLPNDAAARAAALAAALNLQHNLEKIQQAAMPEHYEAELEINDFPQNARWKVTHKETLGPISEWTGAAITTRGQYYPPGKIPGPGERKLYLFIEGPTESSVKKAKAEVKRVLEDYTAQSLSLPGAAQPGKYSVL